MKRDLITCALKVGTGRSENGQRFFNRIAIPFAVFRQAYPARFALEEHDPEIQFKLFDALRNGTMRKVQDLCRTLKIAMACGSGKHPHCIQVYVLGHAAPRR